MKAVVYHAFGGALEVAEVPDPVPEPDGVVLRVTAAGLCRSDWHGWLGHDPDIATMPHVPGHEMAGVVEATGSDVSRWRLGDRVTVPFICACGACPECCTGHPEVCPDQLQPGFGIPGCFAQRVALPRADVNLVALPAGISDEAAAALGCRFATAYRAVVQQGRTQAGEWIAVHGCGGVGLSAVAIAARLGASVVAVDVRESALRQASRLGAAVVVDAGSMQGPSEVSEAVFAATGGGAHVSVDAVGSAAVCAAAVGGLRRRGRHVQVGLLAGVDAHPVLPMGRLIAHELEILGSHGLGALHYAELLSFVERSGIDLGGLVARRASLGEVPELLPAIDRADEWGITVVTDFR